MVSGLTSDATSVSALRPIALPRTASPPALRVGQSKSLTSELLLQDTVLFPEVVDDRVLLTPDPTGHRGNQDLPGIEHRCHPAIRSQAGDRSTAIDVTVYGLEFQGFRFG